MEREYTVVDYDGIGGGCACVGIGGERLIAFERWVNGVPYPWWRLGGAFAICGIWGECGLNIAGVGDGHGEDSLLILGNSGVMERSWCFAKGVRSSTAHTEPHCGQWSRQ